MVYVCVGVFEVWRDKFEVWLQIMPFNLDVFFSRNSNYLITKVYQRSPRTVAGDRQGSFETHVENNNKLAIHLTNLQVLTLFRMGHFGTAHG